MDSVEQMQEQMSILELDDGQDTLLDEFVVIKENSSVSLERRKLSKEEHEKLKYKLRVSNQLVEKIKKEQAIFYQLLCEYEKSIEVNKSIAGGNLSPEDAKKKLSFEELEKIEVKLEKKNVEIIQLVEAWQVELAQSVIQRDDHKVQLDTQSASKSQKEVEVVIQQQH
ncbi:unnamed protein product [Caenorhabditis angaria]|uniref:Uncharacterized protein n=1 Tax=Caenorhabditis angaria TaxID=860376 RepID=A0A9P1I413_9PELO|nr:unnamed protein product [Caenorhabditis angaria]